MAVPHGYQLRFVSLNENLGLFDGIQMITGWSPMNLKRPNSDLYSSCNLPPYNLLCFAHIFGTENICSKNFSTDYCNNIPTFETVLISKSLENRDSADITFSFVPKI